MTNRLNRRDFVGHLGRAASAALIVGFDPVRRSWVRAAEIKTVSGALVDPPPLDGMLVDDEASLAAAADDRGHMIRLRPRAVLRPGSVRDVLRIVQYANRHGLKVAMRGQGHSHYGHAQVEAGIVIDSSTLGRVGAPSGRYLDTEPGASWGAVAGAALQVGLTPPVMPDVMLLSVGGTLSVGGLGATSQTFGAQVDLVKELDVVTGDGRLVTCSAERERQLFESVLAGVGQCGLIVRAKLALMPAPGLVSVRELSYDDLESYLRDHERLAREGRFEHHYGWIARAGDGRWRHVIQVGTFDEEFPPTMTDLRFSEPSATSTTDYGEYLHRLDGFIATSRQQADWTNPRPSVTMFVPAAAAQTFIARLLETPDETAGIWRFDVCPLLTRRFTRPLLRMPAAEVVYSLWMFRTAPAGDPAALQRMLATVSSLIERLRKVGGTVYAPYFKGSPEGWRTELGPEAWQRLSEAKRRFDPNHILTPGPRMFA